MRISTLFMAGVVAACTILLASPATALTTVSTGSNHHVLVLGSMVMLAVASPQAAEASSSPNCPVCNVGTKGDSQICATTSQAAVCIGCDSILNLTTINCNARVGGGENRYNLDQQCSTLINDNDNCGACGNKCQLTTPVCAGTKCNCTINSCDSGSYCNIITTGKCTKCGAGTARCSTFHNSGSQSDCSTILDSDTSNCGACYNQCGPNEVCNGGVCMCGNKPGCLASGKNCLGATDATKSCEECISPTVDDCVQGTYCTNGNACSACPAGMADCTPHGDTGVDGDCETNIQSSGNTPSCGGCSVQAQLHSAITCCKGVPKCGRFANVTNPSDADCNAATACGYDEYCEESLAMCVKMQYSAFNPRGNCDGLAVAPYGGQGLNTPQYCTSCNQTVSKAALNGSTVCYQFDSQNCGAAGNNCSASEVCYKGQCMCNGAFGYQWFAYNSFNDVNPDQNLAIFPEKGCTGYDDKYVLFYSWNNRMTQEVWGLLQCAELARTATDAPTVSQSALKSFTWANISTSTDFKNMACPGGPKLCNATFCDNLISNITSSKKPFCDTLTTLLPFYAYCGVNTKFMPDFPNGNPSCGTTDAIYAFISGGSGWSFVQNAVFVGCPGLEAFTATGVASSQGVLSNYLEAARFMATLGGKYFTAPYNSAIGYGASLSMMAVVAMVEMMVMM